jgi:hypothetical protein
MNDTARHADPKLSAPRLSRRKLLALAALLAAVAFGASAKLTSAAVAPGPGPQECNADLDTRTIAGCFGWTSTAFVNSTTTQATAAVGLMHLDGAGNLTGWYSGSYIGTPTVRIYKGVYSVNPNGTGHMSFTDNYGNTLDYDFVIVNSGNEVFMANTLQGNIQTIQMKRQ